MRSGFSCSQVKPEASWICLTDASHVEHFRRGLAEWHSIRCLLCLLTVMHRAMRKRWKINVSLLQVPHSAMHTLHVAVAASHSRQRQNHCNCAGCCSHACKCLDIQGLCLPSGFDEDLHTPPGLESRRAMAYAFVAEWNACEPHLLSWLAGLMMEQPPPKRQTRDLLASSSSSARTQRR